MFDAFCGREATLRVPEAEPVIAFETVSLSRAEVRTWTGTRLIGRGPDLHADCTVGDRFGALIERPHIPPGQHCGCGIGGSDASVIQLESGATGGNFVQVFAALALWGTLRVSRSRVRSEHGRIEALALAPAERWGSKVRLRRFAAKRRIRVLEAAELRELGESGVVPISALLAAAPEPTLIDVPCDGDRVEPHFRFTFSPTRGRVLHAPYGSAPEIAAGEPAGVGDIVARDHDRAVASFAYVLPSARERAEAELRRWALADDWELTIHAGPRALAPLPPRDYPRHRNIRCTHCGDSGCVSAVAGPLWVQQPYHRTRCNRCGVGRQLRRT